MSTAFFRGGQVLGITPGTAASQTSGSVNATANWVALGFVPDAARTLSTARVYVNSLTGTLGASDITCSIYDSTGASGVPGSSLQSGKLPSATITGAGWYSFTGFSQALTAATTYWLVFKNANGTPASNFCAFRWFITWAEAWLFGQSLTGRNAWARSTSANSGSTWSSAVATPSLRVGYADGTFDGLPVQSMASSADLVYLTRESGAKFTSPPNGVLNVAGLAFMVGGGAGTPATAPRMGLWTGGSPSLLAYTNPLAGTGTVYNSSWVLSYFTSTQAIQPGTVCRATFADGSGNADSSSNAYALTEFAVDSDSSSLGIMPFEGTLAKTYFDGSSWTDSLSSIVAFALLLDPAGEFGSSGGGGGPIGQITGTTARGTYS